MSKKSVNKRSRKYKRRRRRRILFGVEIFVLVLLGVGLFGYMWLNNVMERMRPEELDTSKIQVNSEVQQNIEAMSGSQIIAVAGLDARGAAIDEEDDEYGLKNSQNSDTIILVCIDHDNKEIRMVSIMRDTWMNMETPGQGYDFAKANSAYNRGGPEAMLSMLNTNLDLAIEDYVSVDWKVLADVIDVLGGLDIEMRNAECVWANDYNKEVSAAQGVEYEPIEYNEEEDNEYREVHHLTGSQAVSYARIRYGGGDDSLRTARQRQVINLMMEKVKKSPDKIPAIIDTAADNITTSLSSSEMLQLAYNAVTYTMGTSYAYPFELVYGEHVKDALGEDVVIPVTLYNNVTELHEYLYPGVSYTPSSVIEDYNYYIVQESGYGESKIDSVMHQGPDTTAYSQVSGTGE